MPKGIHYGRSLAFDRSSGTPATKLGPCAQYAALVGARRKASLEANHGPFSDDHRAYSGMLSICIGSGLLGWHITSSRSES